MAVCWCSEHLVKVDYDASVISSRQVALELQNAGLDVESVVWIRVDGMRCQSCIQTIEEYIGSRSGVSNVQVSLQEAAAVIVYRPLLVTDQDLKDHIEELGFSATLLLDDLDLSCWQDDSSDRSVQTVTIWIVGMTCGSCVQSIEGKISQMGGVKSICVSLSDRTGTVMFDPRRTEAEQVRAAIEDMGFDASLQGNTNVILKNEIIFLKMIEDKIPCQEQKEVPLVDFGGVFSSGFQNKMLFYF